MTALAVGARFAWGRLGKRWLLGATLSWVGLVLFGILLERAAFAATHETALFAGVFGIALPFLLYSAALRLARTEPSILAVSRLASYGYDRRLCLAGVWIAFTALGAVFVLPAMAGVLLLGAPASSFSWHDLGTTAWVGCLGASAYAALFLCAASYAHPRLGLIATLGFDWLLGAGSGVLATPWPRAHLRNLLGGVPPLDMTQSSASLVLIATTLVLFGLVSVRAGR